MNYWQQQSSVLCSYDFVLSRNMSDPYFWNPPPCWPRPLPHCQLFYSHIQMWVPFRLISPPPCQQSTLKLWAKSLGNLSSPPIFRSNYRIQGHILEVAWYLPIKDGSLAHQSGLPSHQPNRPINIPRKFALYSVVKLYIFLSWYRGITVPCLLYFSF